MANFLAFRLTYSSYIKGRVHIVYVLLIQFLPKQLYSFTEALEVYDLPFPEELDHIVYIRII